MSWSATRNVAFAELSGRVVTLLGGLAKYGATMALTLQSMSQKWETTANTVTVMSIRPWVSNFRLRLPNEER